jgi:hypothetical protein
MKKVLSLITLALVIVSVMPFVFAVNVGTGITPDIEVEQFAPLVWACKDRVVYDDATEPGRVSDDFEPLRERLYNYAFEGEQISWTVLVMDKNKIDQNIDVFATIGDVQGEGNDIEVNCVRDSTQESYFDSCNAMIDEEKLTTDILSDDLADFFTCTFTVETPESMYGEYWITVEAVDGDGQAGTMVENEYWFLNPVIALSIDGGLEFEEVRPGTYSYSNTLLLGNDADDGSGVMMDMFISGTDFYDSDSAGTRCLDPATGVLTNQLVLGDGDSDCDSTDPFCYFATNGAYNTREHDGRSDVEGYVGINYGIGFNDPTPFYGTAMPDATGFEVLQGPVMIDSYFPANSLSPGSEMALTFRLNLPEPCTGNFDTGDIFFWGEAI